VLTCPVLLHNTGNVRLSDNSAEGDSNNCSKALLAPDEKLHCFMWRTLTVADFTRNTFSIAATVRATAAGLQAFPVQPGVGAQIQNPEVWTALLSVSVTANVTTVHQAGDAVLFTITVVSNHG